MMRKLHLPASPATEGARLTAQAVMRRFDGRVDVAAAKWCVSTRDLEMVIDGTMAPGSWLIRAIGVGTNGAIQRDAWTTDARGGWFDVQQELRAA